MRSTKTVNHHPRGAIAILMLLGVAVFSLMVLTSVSTLASHAFILFTFFILFFLSMRKLGKIHIICINFIEHTKTQIND